MTSIIAHPRPLPTPPRGLRTTDYVGRHRLPTGAFPVVLPGAVPVLRLPAAPDPVVAAAPAPVLAPPRRGLWARLCAAVTAAIVEKPEAR